MGTGVYFTYVAVRTGVIEPSGRELLVSRVRVSPLIEYVARDELVIPPGPPAIADPTTSFDPSQPAVNLAVVAGMPARPPPIWTGVSAFSFSVTESGLLSGVLIVTLSAVCVIVNSNG